VTFTDDDLKRLKVDAEAWVSPYLLRTKVQALLARLEAAEAVAEMFGSARIASESAAKKVEVWRKAAGKDKP